jgi:hypothetical protein
MENPPYQYGVASLFFGCHCGVLKGVCRLEGKVAIGIKGCYWEVIEERPPGFIPEICPVRCVPQNPIWEIVIARGPKQSRPFQ